MHRIMSDTAKVECLWVLANCSNSARTLPRHASRFAICASSAVHNSCTSQGHSNGNESRDCVTNTRIYAAQKPFISATMAQIKYQFTACFAIVG